MGIKWVKLSVGFATDSKIRYIRGCKNGDQMALLWVMVLCRAGAVNDGGRVYVAEGVPYSAASMAAEFHMPAKVVADALTLFEKLGMIQSDADGVTVSKWAEHQNIDALDHARAASRETSRRYRERQKEACHGDVTVTSRDKTEEEKEEEIEGESKKKGIVIDNDNMETRARDRNNVIFNDAYKTSSRARAKTAQIIVDEITARKCFAMQVPDIHDAVYIGLENGWDPERILELAEHGDWGLFASTIIMEQAKP